MAEITNKIDQLTIAAIKSGKTDEATTWRSLKSAFHNEEIKLGHSLDNGEAQQVIKYEHKKRLEAEAEYKKVERTDLAQKEAIEAKLFEQFLPQQLSQKEIETIVARTIQETGAKTKSDLGRVMGPVMEKLKGQADGSTVAQIANRLLQ